MRTYQRLEDSGDLECPFTLSITHLVSYSGLSDYNFYDWITKICHPKKQPDTRNLFRWENDLLIKLNKVDQNIRRRFTNCLGKLDTEKTEMLLKVATLVSQNKDSFVLALESFLSIYNAGKKRK